eukprot:SAG25_NODE_3046_length_1250_cov_1.504778_2_plen_197_part_00
MAHASEVQGEVRTKAAKDWPRYYSMLPTDVQLRANATESAAGRPGCYERYSEGCWQSVKGEFGGQFYAVAVGLALLVVGLLMAALVCAKEIVGVEHIVVKTELLLAHIGLLSGWLLMGLAFTNGDEAGTDIGGYVSSVILITGGARSWGSPCGPTATSTCHRWVNQPRAPARRNFGRSSSPWLHGCTAACSQRRHA